MIVIDSSYLVGLYNERDAHHAEAVALAADLQSLRWGKAILLEYVFLETVNVLLSRRGRIFAQDAARWLGTATGMQFVPCSGLFLNAVADFHRQTATTLSLTDVAIAQQAHSLADGYVATFDQEFRNIPGLTVLPA